MSMQRQGQQQQKQIPWARISVAIILSIIFAVFGAMFALFQWFFPFSSPDTAEPPPIHAPSLIPPITVHFPMPHNSQALNTSVDTFHKRIEQQLSLWMVPYRRNPFFTGREALLTYLHEQLNKNQTTALTQAQAVNGLGGIGKTQTAVEYAYRYRHEYRFVLWIRAATRDTLIFDFVTIAKMLQLPEKDEQDHTITVAAVKRWLMEHESWLLILDNADDLDVIHGSLPTGNNGHILITTRTQAVGSIGRSIEVEKMDGEEGTLFLMRRARILTPESPLDRAGKADRIQAEAIVAAMDGLPLALDQAGAY